MINAKLFADGDQGETTKYMEANFNQELGEGLGRLQCVKNRDELIVVLFGLGQRKKVPMQYWRISTSPIDH
jgi:hypothetical protein